jgi:NADH dehydrogenase
MDVAKAVVHALCNIQTCGQIYELGGPEVLSFKDIYKRLFVYTGQQRHLISLPWPVARVQAFMMSILPNPPLTGDQITSLQTDNIVSSEALGLKDLNIQATPMDLIVPQYLNFPTAGQRD